MTVEPSSVLEKPGRRGSARSLLTRPRERRLSSWRPRSRHGPVGTVVRSAELVADAWGWPWLHAADTGADLPLRPRDQYTSAEFTDLLAQHQMVQSLSRLRQCWEPWPKASSPP